MISKDTIDKIFDAAVIEEIVGEFVNLKKSGTSYKGFSPFTNEKTPSFYVVPHKGIYKCFSSGKGGNAINFLMEHEKFSYPEALRWVADKYGIEIEEDERTEEQIQQKSERESLAIVNAFAQKYFTEQMLNTDEGKSIGLGYFKERGYNLATTDKFLLGYCPDKWDAFTQEALSKGYEIKYLLKSGLSKEKNGNYYDFFRGRVIFPIRNISGKVIAFGARTLRSDKKIAKYYNSPESELYNKSNTLYGLYVSKSTIVKEDNCYLVEGYTDVISLHQAGITNVVASAGTSLTEGQIRKIKRYTQQITILYDGDSAGIKASFRGIDMILSQGMNVRIVLFPDGDDPDSYSMKHSEEEVAAFLHENAKDFIVFKTDLLLADAQDDPIKRAGLIKEIVKTIALIPDPVKRQVYIQECSKILEIDENILIQELNQDIRQNLTKRSKQERKNNPSAGLPPVAIPDFDAMIHGKQFKKEILDIEHQERDMIRLLVNYGKHIVRFKTNENEEFTTTVSEFLLSELESDQIEFRHPALDRMKEEYLDFLHRGEFPPDRYFVNHPDLEISQITSDLVASQYELSRNWTLRHKIYPESEESKLPKALQDALHRLKLRKVQLMMRDINQKIAQGEEDIPFLLRKKILLDRAKVVLSDYFGSVIIN